MEEPLLSSEKERLSEWVWCESKKQLYLAGPLVAGTLMRNLIPIISVMFVGHLGDLALSSASMATSFAVVTGFSLLGGMAGSLETLCGQAFGAKQQQSLGLYMQRAMLVLGLASIPVAVVWTFTGEILLYLGQDREIAAAAGRYIRWMIPAMFLFGPLQCHVRFLQTQNMVLPVMVTSAVTAMIHVLVCWALVYRAGMGSAGAVLAVAVSFLANLTMLAVYVRASPACRGSWTGFSREAWNFHDMVGFLKLAIPSAFMACMEQWSFELMVLLSGLLPNPKLETAVLSICLNTHSLAGAVSQGLSAAISTRVSNELGAGRAGAARLASRVVILLALLLGTSEGLLMLLVRSVLGYAYTNDRQVAEYIATMMPMLAVSVLFDGLQCVLSGVVRGCGLQKMGAYVNLAAYYLLGIPASFFFTFYYHLGGMGLWLGILCGLVAQTLLFLLIFFRNTDWDKQAMDAKDRVFASGEGHG